MSSTAKAIPTRKDLLVLSAALAAVTLTAAAAIAGLARKPSVPVQIVPTVVQPAPATHFREPQEPGG
jgi:hypothetical protein